MLRANAAIALLLSSLLSLTLSGDGALTSESRLALTIGPSPHDEPSSAGVIPLRPAFRRLALSGKDVAWKRRVSNAPLLLTYAVLSHDLVTKDAINCSTMKPAAFALGASRISATDFERELRSALNMWSEAADIDFVETRDEAHADILFGAEATPTGHAFTNVTPGPDGISKALVCLSPGSRWKLGFDGNLDVYDLRYTLAHEIGHAIGLDHPSREGHLMSYRYVETRRGLSDGDRAGVIALYGPRSH